MRTLLIISALLLCGCEHPLEIVGQGDIVELNQTGRGCSYQQFQANDKACVSNASAGEYDVQYYPLAHNGWRFVGWEGICNADSEFPRCALYASADTVRPFWGKRMPPSIAVFEVAEPGEWVSAGSYLDIAERSTVELSGSTGFEASEIRSIRWFQLSGTPASITNADSLTAELLLADVTTSESFSLVLEVILQDGSLHTDRLEGFSRAYTNIDELAFEDTALQACVADTASVNAATDVSDITTLTCESVTDLEGIGQLERLDSLTLTNNSVESLAPLLDLAGLSQVSLTGNSNLPCDEVDDLVALLGEAAVTSEDLCRASLPVALAAEGFDTVMDNAREQLYVSLPTRNEIAVVSLTEGRVVDRILLTGSPYGIDLSIDGSRLFAALKGSTAVAAINLDTRDVESIPLADRPGNALTHDVVEGAPGRLFVSAAPGSGGFAYISQVKLDENNQVSRVASNRIIRANPVFARSPDYLSLYIGEGFSPNSLYRLNLASDEAPIALEDDHGSVSGTNQLSVNLLGNRIALTSGQVVRTGSFIEEGRIGIGRSTPSTAQNLVHVVRDNRYLDTYSFETLALESTIGTGCVYGETERVVVDDADDRFGLLQGETLCVYAQVSRSMPPDEFEALRLSDLALENCVIEAAVQQGFTTPEEFEVLDCSQSAQEIVSLESLASFSNLEQLDISNSGVFDLTPLAELGLLRTLTATNAALVDLEPLAGVAALSSVNVTGNPGIGCAALDELAASGVQVVADQCTETTRIELSGIGSDLVYDAPGNRAFVSVPSTNQVVEVDLTAKAIAQSFTLPGQPRGIDLDANGQTLYTALFSVGDIAILNTATGNFDVVDLSEELDNDSTWDIVRVTGNRLLVSANPGSGGFAYIVAVQMGQGNSAVRVASNRIIRAAPVFVADANFAYVGEGFSPNSLYKLDLSETDIPIILEDNHGDVSGTSHLSLSPDGGRVYTTSGQALDTATFNQLLRFASGISVPTSDGNSLLIWEGEPTATGVYDTTTGVKTGSRDWGCSILDLATMRELPGDGVLALGDDLLCFTQVVSYP